MSYECIIEENIVIFKFNYGKVNAITTETLEALNGILDRLNNEEELKGLILTGEGRYLSGGFDLATFTSFKDGDEIIKWFELEEDVMYKLFTCPKPVIAAVNGHATAAGMIVSMASDYVIAVNHPKIKLGMTEIKIGLALTPAEMEIMRFGLDTNKNMKDVVFKGELFGVQQAYDMGIFDELVETPEELMEKAKAKVSALIDTPGRPFILLKEFQRKHVAEDIQKGLKEYNWDELVKTFTDESIIGTLKMVLAAIS
ncbi:MAG: enoyl-CoA hydratase/isomerase family protein [Syntrophomonadaceae bacterium]|nr:enoyl-CoA hydratase/isomerase family protein [Syntrophomonadaceae bacterium]